MIPLIKSQNELNDESAKVISLDTPKFVILDFILEDVCSVLF